jgi:hypothetical protein
VRPGSFSVFSAGAARQNIFFFETGSSLLWLAQFFHTCCTVAREPIP